MSVFRKMRCECVKRLQIFRTEMCLQLPEISNRMQTECYFLLNFALLSRWIKNLLGGNWFVHLLILELDIIDSIWPVHFVIRMRNVLYKCATIELSRFRFIRPYTSSEKISNKHATIDFNLSYCERNREQHIEWDPPILWFVLNRRPWLFAKIIVL